MYRPHPDDITPSTLHAYKPAPRNTVLSGEDESYLKDMLALLHSGKPAMLIVDTGQCLKYIHLQMARPTVLNMLSTVLSHVIHKP
jgi:hypothetical protein